jgi:hypothetical protein
MLGVRGQHYRPHDVDNRLSVPALLGNIREVGEVARSWSWSFFVLDLFATSRSRTTTTTSTIWPLVRLTRYPPRRRARFLCHGRSRTTTTTSTIRPLARLTRYPPRRRARFLRRKQIEDDDDHEHDQAIGTSYSLSSSSSCSISLPPADRGRRRPRARSGDWRFFSIKTQNGDSPTSRSRFRCHPWSRYPREKKYSFDDPKRNDGATPSTSRLTGSPGPLLAGLQGQGSTKRRT